MFFLRRPLVPEIVEFRYSRSVGSSSGLQPELASIHLEDRHDAGLWRTAGDMNLSLSVNEYVDLAAHAELRQIDAWLDREASAWQHLPFFVRLQVVHIGAVAMCFLADGMAGAMTEGRTVASLLDYVTRCLVHLPAA